MWYLNRNAHTHTLFLRQYACIYHVYFFIHYIYLLYKFIVGISCLCQTMCDYTALTKSLLQVEICLQLARRVKTVVLQWHQVHQIRRGLEGATRHDVYLRAKWESFSSCFNDTSLGVVAGPHRRRYLI